MTPRSRKEPLAPIARARLSIAVSAVILASLAFSFFTTGQRLLAVIFATAAAALVLALILAEIGRRS